jgi:HAD superfamily hydrolase (TIGR01549 family)
VAEAASPGERWVALDVGETLIDETRIWSIWADVLGIPRLTFMAALGASVARGEEHVGVFELVGRPDWREHRGQVRAAYGGFQQADLYPDARRCVDELRSAGYRTAILANQPAERTAELCALGIEADVMAMSEELGVHKPDPEFYRRGLALMGDPDPAHVAYVGDRIDNDVLPSAAAGMRAVWLRRGPWAVIGSVAPANATLVVDSLDELVEHIGSAWPAPVAR